MVINVHWTLEIEHVKTEHGSLNKADWTGLIEHFPIEQFFVQLVYDYLYLGEQVICSIDPLFNVNLLNESMVKIVLFNVIIVQNTSVQVGFVLIVICSIDFDEMTQFKWQMFAWHGSLKFG